MRGVTSVFLNENVGVRSLESRAQGRGNVEGQRLHTVVTMADATYQRRRFAAD
jgi:hypothetical protein